MERGKKNKSMRATGENACFAASNGKKGFQSYYAEIFDRKEIKRVYAIKGGPGTGKSRFLRDVLIFGEGLGWRAETVYCSSDPDSLDGVILWKDGHGIALLDATLPHAYEPTLPGTREEIVNLGDFWSAELLEAHTEEIAELNRLKSDGYRRAYRYLSTYGEVSANRESLIRPCLRTHAAKELAARLTNSIPVGTAFLPQTALMRSVGMRGSVSLDTYFANAKSILLIEDYHGAGYCLLEEIYRCLSEKRLRVRVSRDPILPERVDALFLPDVGCSFAVASVEECAYPFRKIHTRRLMDAARLKKCRADVRYAERMCEALLSGAITELDGVRELHFALEELYSSSMDFARKEAFTRAFCERIFCLQNE